MKAQAITHFGDCSVFKSIELDKPKLKPGTVLIRVLATSVNPIDCKLRAGMVPAFIADFPVILHGDVAGIVEEVHPTVTEFQVGDEVYGCAGGVKPESGALAEFMLADAKLIARKPKSINMIEAAALPLVCITAWEALIEKVNIKPGQKVLIHAGMGGVGHIAIQLAKWKGADVYTTVSSSEKMKLVEAYGVTEAINYHNESVENYVERITDGNGFDIVFDTVGGKNLDNSFLAVAPYGNVITIQARSSHDLSPLYNKSASLHMVLMLLPLLRNIDREKHGKILTSIAELVDKKILKPYVDSHRFSFEQISEAHQFLESGKALGKIVVHRT